MEIVDLTGRLAALRERIGPDADRLTMFDWAVSLLGPHCFRVRKKWDPQSDDSLILTSAGYRILLDRERLQDPASVRADIAYGIARWALRDLADHDGLATFVNLLSLRIQGRAAADEVVVRVRTRSAQPMITGLTTTRTRAG